jgi:hypothetical protein
MHIGFSSLKTHVCLHVWFSSFYQLWFFELENPCVWTHMLFKLSPTLDFQAWKPCALAHMVFKLSSPLDFWPWKPHVLDFPTWKSMCVDAYDFQVIFNSRFPSLKTHVCQRIWFSSYFQFWISKLENPCVPVHMVFKFLSILDFWTLKPMCVGTYGFQATLNSSLPNLISKFILFWCCF